MAKGRINMTSALRVLKASGVDHEVCSYKYEDKGGAANAARQLNVDQHLVIKTLVFEDQDRNPMLVLMHGDREVSTKKLARAIGAKTINPCDPTAAMKHTGYQVGGISPFGTRKKLPVYVQASILELPRILINAGKRGLLVKMIPSDLVRLLKPEPVQAAV